MYSISIDASPSQLRKLKKGHRVRVKSGTGFELMVHPSTYNIVSRAFSKNKGSEISLSPEELDANRSMSKSISPESHTAYMGAPEIAGRGLTDNISGAISPFLDKYTTPEQKVVLKGKAKEVIHGLGLFDNSMNGIGSRIRLADSLNDHLGTNYGYMSRAGLDNAMQHAKSAALSKMSIDARYKTVQAPLGLDGPHSRIIGGALERSSIGRNGGMLSSFTPPALVSQPFGANFQFQHFLPPQYHHFNSGGGEIGGSGLYL